MSPYASTTFVGFKAPVSLFHLYLIHNDNFKFMCYIMFFLLLSLWRQYKIANREWHAVILFYTKWLGNLMSYLSNLISKLDCWTSSCCPRKPLRVNWYDSFCAPKPGRYAILVFGVELCLRLCVWSENNTNIAFNYY